MNPTAIFSKTGKGVQEASGKTSNLSRADRAVLSAIDGKSNVGALYKKFEKTPQAKFDQLIDRLEREGYIREASPGVTSAPASTKPSAPPPSKPMDVVSDLDFTGVFTPASAPPSVPKGPTVDLAAKARAEAERRAQEESLGYKAREAAEAKAKAEAEKKAKADAEARARESASVRSREEAEAKERAEGEAKLRAAQQTALRVAAEEKAKTDKLRAEAEAKEKAEAELRQRKEEEERKRREEQARKAREEEEERKRKEEEERKRREEEERKRKEEEERKRREEEERKRKEEEEARRRKEEEARKQREEAEARRRKEEEEARRQREEAEARRRKEEEQARKRREEEEAARRREEEQARKRREEEEAERRREEERARAEAPSGEKFADSLLADLNNFAERDDAESRAKEEAARKEKEQTERARREQQARAESEERERKRREDEERARREHERRARELEEAEARNVVDASSDSRAKRRLAAIVAADVAGYSRLMGIDEEGTLTRFKRIMRELIQPKVEEHDGRIVKTAGDGMLIEFPSVVDAVRFAVQVQTAVANEEADVPPTRQIAFRMGINLGDIIGEDNDVYGDGVNVAARLEGLADKGGICIAGVVYDQIRDKVTYTIEDLGQQKLKNITRPVRAYKIKGDWETAKLRREVDPASLPHRALAPGKAADEVVVSDEDLDMDEVKRDEQALTKEALKAQREREREARRRKKAADADVGPIKIRRRRRWGKPIAVTLLLALIAGVGAVHVVPVETGQYAKVASAAFGRNVKIGAARMSLLNGPEMRFEGVRIGDIVIDTVRVFPTLASLFSDKKVLGRVELIGALVPENELGDVLLGRMKSTRFSVVRVEAKELRLRGPLALPAFDVDAALSGNGALKSLVLNGPDKLQVKLVPDGGQLALEGSAASLTLPFATQVTLTDFSLKGSATPEGMTLSEWDGSLLDGTLAGTARFSWGPSWRIEGTLKFKNVNAAVFAPALLSDGKASGSGSFLMQGAVPAKLGVDARVDGGFKVSKGMLGSFDLSRAIRTSGKETQGTTLFAELSGKGSYDKGAVQLRDVNIAAGALNAGAIVDIAPAGALSGRIVADVKTAGQTLRSTINLAGTVKQPEVKK
ncbi:MAG: adenylate/guanylate cyclase domain-containing protein [Burkholderiales bacterium]